MRASRNSHSAVLAAVLAFTLGASALAQAQPRDDRRGPPPHAQANGHRPGGPGGPGPGPNAHRPPPPPPPHVRPGPGPRPSQQIAHQMEHRRGAGPDHRWMQGGRVPPQYRTQHYVVNNWRGHHLQAPPRGYHWVQYGGDYMLVAIASGVIAQLVLGGGF